MHTLLSNKTLELDWLSHWRRMFPVDWHNCHQVNYTLLNYKVEKCKFVDLRCLKQEKLLKFIARKVDCINTPSGQTGCYTEMCQVLNK